MKVTCFEIHELVGRAILTRGAQVRQTAVHYSEYGKDGQHQKGRVRGDSLQLLQEVVCQPSARSNPHLQGLGSL